MIQQSDFKKINREVSPNPKQSGFIQIAVIIIGALVILKYAYDIDVVGFLTTGKFRVWLDKIYNLASLGWQKYDAYIIKIWNYFIDFAKNLVAKARG